MEEKDKTSAIRLATAFLGMKCGLQYLRSSEDFRDATSFNCEAEETEEGGGLSGVPGGGEKGTGGTIALHGTQFTSGFNFSETLRLQNNFLTGI
jgi:hypothetical protein